LHVSSLLAGNSQQPHSKFVEIILRPLKPTTSQQVLGLHNEQATKRPAFDADKIKFAHSAMQCIDIERQRKGSVKSLVVVAI
jgi:hypothetical protein